MKVIDLLNKIANGEINEDIKIEYQYGLSYEYCVDIDEMVHRELKVELEIIERIK